MPVPFLELLHVKFQYWLKRALSFPKKEGVVQKNEILDCPIEILRDRFSTPYVNHPHLQAFSFPFNKAVSLYEEYTNYIHTHQYGQWLEKLGIGSSLAIPYWITPWGGAEKKYEGYRLTKRYAERYIKDLLSTKKSLEVNGYVSEKFPPITGQVLIDNNNQKRVIIWNGNRRTLSLIQLGHKTIPVEISGGNRWKGFRQQTTIRLSDLPEWENVKNKMYSPAQAYHFFQSFFSS